MSTLTAAFRADSERIHNDHVILDHILFKLDRALDHMVCYSEVFADFSDAGDVHRYGQQLIDHFPEHCRREEQAVLSPVSEVSAELREFCTRMKEEHAELLARLGMFRVALEEFNKAEDLEEAVRHLKDEGKELTSFLRHHVAAEEHELSGFL